MPAGALDNDLTLGGGTAEAAKYIAAHKPGLAGEAGRAARERILEILNDQGLLPQ